MKILPKLLCAFAAFTILLSAYAQDGTLTNISITPIDPCYNSCKDPFDTLVLCAVPFSPIDNLMVYMNTSYYTPDQRQCLCKTRGFLRSALDCFYCHEIDLVGWERWCAESTSQRSLSPGAIAGIIVGVVVLVGGATYALYRRSKSKERAGEVEAPVCEQDEERMKLELRRGSEVVELPMHRPVRELDGYEMRAELPGN